ncbi:MAG TPA: TrkA family potassium uptake protein [Ktedonobacterales bacterium]|jgi:trk system potassium uptake protein TrkA
MRILIMGCGRVGATLANMMANEGHDVTIMDISSVSFARLGRDFPGANVIGDGTDEAVLRRAGIEETECFVAVTNGDNRNILAAQIAKNTFHVPRVICRIYDPKRQETYAELGLDSICPTVVSAQLIRNALLDPAKSLVSAAQSLAEGRSVPLRGAQQEGATPAQGTTTGSKDATRR